LVTFSGLALAASAQGTSDPTPAHHPGRDRLTPALATAAISGRVVDGITGVPVSRATLRLQGAAAGTIASATTGPDGGFSLANLPPGGYTIFVEKPTYLLGRFPTRGRSVREMQRQLNLVEGQLIKDLVMRIVRGGAIAGRVLSPDGDPLDRVEVRVLRLSRRADANPAAAGTAQTNDVGEFRVGRLDAGSYLVLAMPRTTASPAERPASESVVETQALPSYYPGVLTASEAQPVVVEAGQTQSGVEITLAQGTKTLVTGRVIREDGGQIGPAGFVTLRGIAGEQSDPIDAGAARLHPDGSFRVLMAPGQYSIDARVSDLREDGQPAAEFVGSAQVTVGEGGVSMEDVVIPVGPGAIATGVVVFPQGSDVPRPSGGRLSLFTGEGNACRSGGVTISPSWTFRIQGLAGNCIAQQGRIAGRWVVKAILLDGENVVGQPFEFSRNGRVGNLQVIATDRTAEVSLRVTDQEGRLTRDYVAVVYPAMRALWRVSSAAVRTFVPAAEHVDVPSIPHTTLAPTAAIADRRDTVKAITPGEYWVVAVDDIGLDDLRDPKTLERLAANAIRITLSEGAATEVALRRVKFADVSK
jgi:hypothetical protein